MQHLKPRTPYSGWPSRFAHALSRLRTDPHFQTELTKRGIKSFGTGGCAILAAALAAALGPEARLVGLREAALTDIEHVAVECGGWYLDAYGVRDETQLLAEARTLGSYEAPVLTDFRLTQAAANRIRYAGAEELVAALTAHFRPLV